MDDDKPLPQFRRDLQLFGGPNDSDGSPTYNIYDPVKGQYYKLGWAEYSIMQMAKPGITMNQLLAEIKAQTTIQVTQELLTHFYAESLKMGLLHVHQESESLLKEFESNRLGAIKSVLYYYLFFRIPLANPDRFLEKTLPYVRPLLTPAAQTAYLGIALWGLMLVLSHWDEFFHTVTYFFNWQGAVVYTLGIIGVKIVHELAHAYTAKKYGVHITSTGVAFLVLVPVLFTDATDSWKLASRRKRMAITSAGVLAELAMAGIATVLWAFSEPGLFQSICFVIASINWVSTLFINLNPAMRYDGYYLLSDWLGVENLQDRSFALLRRRFYAVFMGLNLADPDASLSPNLRRLMVCYAVFTFCYRVIIYTAIALFVYFQFTKVLGAFLLAMEIIIFFIWPVVYETNIYLQMRQHITWNWRFVLTSLAFLTLCVWFVLPWPHTYYFEAITVPRDLKVIYTPESGLVTDVYVKHGDKVITDQPVVTISSYILENKLAELKAESSVAGKKAELTQEAEDLRPLYTQKQQEYLQLRTQSAAAKNKLTLLTVVSHHAGYLFEWDDQIRPGVYVKKGQTLGMVATKGAVDVVAFVPERDRSWLVIGQSIVFRVHHGGEIVKGVVVEAPPSRLRSLNYPALASVNKGPLAVMTSQNKELVFEESYYGILIRLDNAATLRFGEVGKVSIEGPWSSLLVRLVDHAISIVTQESNL